MSEVKDIAFGEIAVHLGFVNQDDVDRALAEQAGLRAGKSLGDILADKKLITSEQRERVIQHQAKLLQEIKLEDKLRREAHLFAKFARQKGMVTQEQREMAVKLFDMNKDKSKTMAQIMIENGLLSEEQVSEISMSQRRIKMFCEKCNLRFTVVTITQKQDLPCPKCKSQLKPAKDTSTRTAATVTPRPQLFTQIFRTVKKTEQAGQTKRIKKVRCPICDHEFQGELDKDSRTICTSCGTSFEVL